MYEVPYYHSTRLIFPLYDDNVITFLLFSRKSSPLFPLTQRCSDLISQPPAPYGVRARTLPDAARGRQALPEQRDSDEIVSIDRGMATPGMVELTPATHATQLAILSKYVRFQELAGRGCISQTGTPGRLCSGWVMEITHGFLRVVFLSIW